MATNTTVRLVFSKSGRARFISHLDLARTIQRALKRSGLPIWYTEGYNPRIYVMFPLPLSLGIISCCEIADIRLTDGVPFEKIVGCINSVLTKDIKIISAAEPISKHTEIAWAEYNIYFPEATDLTYLQNFMDSQEIIITRSTKRKTQVQLDIKPMIRHFELFLEQSTITVHLAAGSSENLSPAHFISALNVEQYDSKILVERSKILKANGEIFS